MTGFSPSDAALEGFRLTRERPATMFGWAIINLTGVTLIGGLMLVGLGGPFIEFVKKGGLGQIDPEKLASVMAASWPAFLGVVLAVFLFSAILVAGVYRLVLRPEEPGFVHLRVGGVEARIMLVSLALFPLGILGFAFINFIGAAAAQWGGLGLGIIAALMATVPVVYVGIRLLLVTPTIFATGRIRIREAWEMTRGRFWSLLGMTVLSAIFYVIVWTLVLMIHTAVMMLAGGVEAVYSFGRIGGPLSIAALLVILTLEAILPVMQLVLLTGPVAVAYKHLSADRPTIAGQGASST